MPASASKCSICNLLSILQRDQPVLWNHHCVQDLLQQLPVPDWHGEAFAPVHFLHACEHLLSVRCLHPCAPCTCLSQLHLYSLELQRCCVTLLLCSAPCTRATTNSSLLSPFLRSDRLYRLQHQQLVGAYDPGAAVHIAGFAAMVGAVLGKPESHSHTGPSSQLALLALPTCSVECSTAGNCAKCATGLFLLNNEVGLVCN